MVDFLIDQLSERLPSRYNSVFIVFYSVDYIIIRHAAFGQIIEFLHFSTMPTVNYIIKPFEIIGIEFSHTISVGDNRINIQIIEVV